MQANRLRLAVFAALLAFGAARSGGAALIVSAPSFSVSPGTLVQAQFQVSNSASAAVSDIEGMSFTAQIAAGTGLAPKITALDLLTGTIWSGHVSAASVTTPTGGNQLQYQSRDLLTDNPGDFVDANGLLATVTIDTTGAAPGNYAIKLVGTKTAGRDSEFLDGLGDTITATFGQGQITVVPEPNGVLLCAIAGILVVLTISRR